jgi:hypothetical protein
VFLEFLANIVFWAIRAWQLERQPFRNALSRIHSGWLCLVLLAAFSFLGCQDAHQDNPIQPRNEELGYRVFRYHGDSVDLQVTVQKLSDRRHRTQMKDVRVEVKHAVHQKTLMTLVAENVESPRGHPMATIEHFVLTCDEGTEIAGDRLQWYPDQALGLQTTDPITLTNEKGILNGKGLRGDLLMRHYTIDKVESVRLWDDIAGGREGHQRGD